MDEREERWRKRRGKKRRKEEERRVMDTVYGSETTKFSNQVVICLAMVTVISLSLT